MPTLPDANAPLLITCQFQLSCTCACCCLALSARLCNWLMHLLPGGCPPATCPSVSFPSYRADTCPSISLVPWHTVAMTHDRGCLMHITNLHRPVSSYSPPAIFVSGCTQCSAHTPAPLHYVVHVSTNNFACGRAQDGSRMPCSRMRLHGRPNSSCMPSVLAGASSCATRLALLLCTGARPAMLALYRKHSQVTLPFSYLQPNPVHWFCAEHSIVHSMHAYEWARAIWNCNLLCSGCNL